MCGGPTDEGADARPGPDGQPAETAPLPALLSAPGASGVELLGLEAEAAVSTVSGTVVRRAGAARLWLGLAAATVAVAIGAWAVSRVGSPSDERTSPAANTAPPTSADRDAGGDTSRTPAPPTTELSEDTGPTAVTTSGEGAVLGQPVGWSLLYGSSFERGGDLTRLDLDTGAEVRHGEVDGGPALVVGPWLVLDESGSGGGSTFHIVPLADPARAGVEVEQPTVFGPWNLPVSDGSDDAMWLYRSDTVSASWQRIRMTDGTVIDEVPAAPFIEAPPVPGGGPDVATSGSGGVYRRVDGSYRFLAPGRPMVVSDGAVLIRDCSSPLACGERWIDLDDGQPVDRLLPPEDSISWQQLLPGSDRFLFGWRLESGFEGANRVAVFDLDEGRLIEPHSGSMGTAAASPDGRVVAFDTEAGIELYDLVQDRWFVAPRPDTGTLSLAFLSNG